MEGRRPATAGAQIRLAFTMTAGLLVAVAAAYALYTFRIERNAKWERLTHLVSFVAETSRLYFNHYNSGFALLSQNLRHVGVRRHPVRVQRILQRFRADYPALSAVAIVGAHGHLQTLVTVDPSLAAAWSWKGWPPTSAGRLVIGRPQRITGGHHAIPLYFPVERPRQHRRFVIEALLTLRAQQAIWARLSAPRHTELGLLRSDGYLQSRWPHAPPLTYRTRATGALARAVARDTSAAGRYQGYVIVNHIYRLGAYQRLDRYPLVAFASIPESAVVTGWVQRIQGPLIVLLGMLAATYGLYRWTLARQRIWEQERRRGERQLFAAKERVEVTLRSILDAVITTDTKGRIQYLNPTAERMTGWTQVETVGRPLNDIFPCLDERNGNLLDPIPRCVQYQTVGPEDALLLHRDGRALAVERTATPMRDRDGMLTGVVLVFHDVTEKRMLADRLAHQASHDPLTGLPNRAYFNEYLAQALIDTDARHDQLALLFIDLDGFKRVNDTLGHTIGDQVLVSVSARLREVLRTSDFLVRLGGDEFAVVLSRLRERYEALPVVRKLATAFAEPVLTAPEEIFLSASIGIAIYPLDATNVQGLAQAADTAMYEAKASGKNAHRFYKPSMREHNAYLLSLESHLRRGLERGEFHLLYQPQIWLQTGLSAGVEALVRWRHPNQGIIYPAQFIPLAEETGLILPLGAWILRTACNDARDWQGGEDHRRISVAINISGRQCRHDETPELLRQILRQTTIVPANLSLELSEAALVQEPGRLLGPLRSLKDLGLVLVVDHFGAGFSSLGYLKQFPVDALKIDQSFIRDVPGDTDNEAIIHAIVALARALNLLVMVAGVETETQYQFLREAGCDIAQGLYISAPLTAVETTSFLRRARS